MFQLIVSTSKRVAWISDDSATANLVLSRVRLQSESGQLPLPIVGFLQPVTFDQWKAGIRIYDNDPCVEGLLIRLYHNVKNHIDGQSIFPADVMKWTVENTSKPIIGFRPFLTDDGAICAVVVDPKELGKAAGMLSKQILAGKKAGDLHLVVN